MINQSDREYIVDRLHAIQREHDITILHACESGSRAWGFPSPDSDFDVRFIYVSNLRHYLRVPGALKVLQTEPQLTMEVVRDELDSTNLKIHNKDPSLYDLAGWDLRFALELARKGNAVLLEWLNSPIVYTSQVGFHDRVLSIVQRNVWQPERTFYHYRSLVLRILKENVEGHSEVKLKKYLYALRSMFAAMHVKQYNSVPPLDFRVLMHGVDFGSPALVRECELLLDLKRNQEEVFTMPSNSLLNEALSLFVEHEAAPEKVSASTLRAESLNELLFSYATADPAKSFTKYTATS